MVHDEFLVSGSTLAASGTGLQRSSAKAKVSSRSTTDQGQGEVCIPFYLIEKPVGV